MIAPRARLSRYLLALNARARSRRWRASAADVDDEGWRRADAANLRTKILDFGGFDESRISITRVELNFHVRRESPGHVESTNLSRAKSLRYSISIV